MTGQKRDHRITLQKARDVLAQPVKYMSVSVVVFLCDSAVFLVLHNYLIYGHEYVSYVIGRFFGAAIGYVLNRRLVFRFEEPCACDQVKAIVKYAVLATINTAIGLVLMEAVRIIPHVFPYLAKLMADAVLYVATFFLQREVVFRRKIESVRQEE